MQLVADVLAVLWVLLALASNARAARGARARRDGTSVVTTGAAGIALLALNVAGAADDTPFVLMQQLGIGAAAAALAVRTWIVVRSALAGRPAPVQATERLKMVFWTGVAGASGHEGALLGVAVAMAAALAVSAVPPRDLPLH